ncbi:hypothetical protein P154DRAFT_601476 [Amniculicola lignicola CBS 123094]|uniref:Indole-diterpene biosynthesis protein-like protein PaxU n=1 Tax=Amniculicola lignicola CBS 123094 TaxID=1392246 RepID=A0A6A5WJS8_9PLEO|nr:hypothetical protein P154DRAFT_601476 [Amniculicola lignicola CBS 123094]
MDPTHPYKKAKLNTWATLYTPVSQADNELIILCTWLGALPKHIKKYIAMYHAITPTTPILLIESSIWTVTAPYPIQLSRMHTLLPILHRALASTIPTVPKLLIHTFSNGGSNSATQLLLAYHREAKSALPLQGIICDSGPAKGEYWKSHRSMMVSLPRHPVWQWVIGPPLAHGVLVGMRSGVWMGRYPVFEDLIRGTLVDEKVVGGRGTGNGKRRITYVWGKGDEQVDWRDVEGHAEVARERGWEVESEEFVGSGHCDHARIDGARYRRILGDIWNAQEVARAEIVCGG